MKNYYILFLILITYKSLSQTTIDYETDIQPIFDNSCMPCHSGNSPSAGLNLTSYSNVIAGSNSGAVVIPGNYENSTLWQEVNSGDMPNNIANNNMGIPDLNASEIQLIAQWIEEGANPFIDQGCEDNNATIEQFFGDFFISDCTALVNYLNANYGYDLFTSCNWNGEQMTDFGGLTIGDICECTCEEIQNTLIIESSKTEKYLFSININGSIVQNSKKNTVVFDVYDSGKVIKRLIID